VVKGDITTALDVLGLLLVAGGAGWMVKEWIGWGSAAIVTGIIVLVGSMLSDLMTRER